MKHTLKSIIICLLAIIVFASCSKNDGVKIPQIDGVNHRPIASLNLATGEMTYQVSPEMLQDEFDNLYASKGSDNPYIIESLEIITSSKSEEKPGLQFSVIDTDKEISTKTLLKGFLVNETRNDTVFYYFDSETESGSFQFVDIGKVQNCLVSVTDGNITNVEVTDDPMEYSNGGHYSVRCEGHNCIGGTCAPLANDMGCSPCNKEDEDHWCSQIYYPNGNWDPSLIVGVIGIILTILFGFGIL